MNLTTRWLFREELISGPHGFTSKGAVAGEKETGRQIGGWRARYVKRMRSDAKKD
jgi:hypothetical protein